LKKPVRAWQRLWCGVAASLRSRSRGRKARRGAGATRRHRDRRRSAGQRKRARSTRRCAAYPAARRRRFLHRLFARFRQLHGPGPLPLGINFEKPGAVIAAGQAVADAADGELLVASAHNGLSHPFDAAIVVDGLDIITTSPRRTPCSDRTSDKHRMEHLRQLKISDELSAAGQQTPVFTPRNGTADIANTWEIAHPSNVSLAISGSLYKCSLYKLLSIQAAHISGLST